MMTRTLVIAALALVLGTGGAAARPGGPAGPPQVADKGQGNQAKRDKIKERIRIMRAMVLTEQLDLDEATAGKMFPILAKYDDALAKLTAERQQLRGKLATARRGGKPADITAALDQLVANQRARWNAEDQRFAELRAVLTPEQAAALLDLLPEVDKKILRGLRNALGGGGRGRGDLVDPFARGGADDDDGAVPTRRRGPRTRDMPSNPFDTRQ